MSSTLKPITGLAISPSTVTLLYTVPALTTATLLNLIVMNQGGSAGTYQIWHLASGDAIPTVATDGIPQKYVHDQPLAAKERQVIDNREVMAAGAKIYVFSTVAAIARGSVMEQA